MSAADQTEVAKAPQASSFDVGAQIASLHAAGAHRFDPVRLHYLEVLARRASVHQGAVRRMLDAKLEKALSAFQERFDQTHSEAKESIAGCVAHHPQASDELQQLLTAGDFAGVRRCIASLTAGRPGASLTALVRQLEPHAPEICAPDLERFPVSRPELKAIRDFRNTWSKLSIDRQVAQALEQAPANAGPINSHMLVLRSLELMRDISPDYLNRFISYADTLLCLDRSGKEAPGNTKKRPVAKRAKK